MSEFFNPVKIKETNIMCERCFVQFATYISNMDDHDAEYLCAECVKDIKDGMAESQDKDTERHQASR